MKVINSIKAIKKNCIVERFYKEVISCGKEFTSVYSVWVILKMKWIDLLYVDE